MRLILNIIFSGVIIVFRLLIRNSASFHLMVSIYDECKYKRLVKTTFKSCVGSLSSSKFTTRAIEMLASLFIKNDDFQPNSASLTY